MCILLTLLHPGIKIILPGTAFASLNVLNFMAENFGIGPVSAPEADGEKLPNR